jgi:hypothetical protein
MATRYEPDRQGVGMLMMSDEMREMLRLAAERGAEYARSIAPAGHPPGDPHPGEYAASFRVEVVTPAPSWDDRPAALIVNDSPHAAYVEWQDGYHVLARAAEAMGAT